MSIKETLATEPAAETNAEESNGPEMVELHQAGIEDIDAALENAQAEEASAPPSADATDSQETPSVEPAAEQNSTEGVVNAGATPSKPRTYTEEEIQGFIAENERLKKEGNQKELFIKHRGTELGQLRAENAQKTRDLEELRARLANGLDDRFVENPKQALEDRDRIKQIDQDIEALETREARATGIVEAQTLFLRHVDIDKVSLDDVADVLRSEGMDESFVAQFKANPWEFTSPETLVQFGKRAMERKEYTKADADRRLLAKHVLYLNEQLKAQKSRPGQVLAQVQKNLNQAPPLKSTGSSSPKAAMELDPVRMSISELDAALKHATRH